MFAPNKLVIVTREQLEKFSCDDMVLWRCNRTKFGNMSRQP